MAIKNKLKHASAHRKFNPALLALMLTSLGLLAGCETELMPTPNIYTSGQCTLFVDVPAALQTSTIDLLYVTDRKPEMADDGSLRYTYERSPSVAFGSAKVEIGHNLDWDALVAASTTATRDRNFDLNVRTITELGRLAPTPIPLIKNDAGELVDDPAIVAHQRELAEKFCVEVRRRLAEANAETISLYTHGFANDFDYAACVLAEFWHFGGRSSVPLLYSWPAGSPGLVRGYTHDRESCEFTIYHLKQTIKLLASMPEVRHINVIAHSRGTDVLGSALRELMIEERGAGRKSRESLKIGRVVLASPDMDYDVVRQRFAAERFYNACEHLTIYVSMNDKALGMAEWLLQSHPRLGSIKPENLTEDQRQQLALIGSMDVIDVRIPAGFIGHDYYHSCPAASSDIILNLRYHAVAGSPQRPLKQVAPNYFVLEDAAYPGPAAPKPVQ